MIDLTGLAEWASISALAEGVQAAVDSGKWAYLAVISVFIFIQLAKRSDHVKKNATRYSAGLGAATGAVLSPDPVSGAVGGLLVGNAASGLYSLLKPVITGDLLKALLLALKLTGLVYGKAKEKKDKQVVKDFEKAIEKTKGEEPTTEDLEKWFKENL